MGLGHAICRIINEKWQKFGCRLYLQWTVLPFALLIVWFSGFVCLRTAQVHSKCFGGAMEFGTSSFDWSSRRTEK